MFLSILSVQDGNTSDGFINCGGGEKFIRCFFPRQVNFVSSRCIKMGRYSIEIKRATSIVIIQKWKISSINGLLS